MTISLPPQGNDAKVLGAYFSPLKVEALATPEMRVLVAEGAFWTADNEHQEFIGGASPTFSAPGADAKWVLLTVTPNGALNLIDGVAGTSPELPDVSLYKDQLPLAAIFVGDTVTAITNDMIYDIRPLWQIPPDSVSQTQLTDFATITYVDNGLASKAETDGTASANFTLNVGGGSINDTGIYVDRQSGPDVAIRFNELATSGSPAVVSPQWEFTNDGSTWNAIGVSSGNYYLKTELNAGALDHLYYQQNQLTGVSGSGVLDSRYYEQADADALFSVLGHDHVLADITDLLPQVETVNLITPVAGDVSLNINDILDVYNVGPTTSHTLIWSTANSRFENAQLKTGDLIDVDTFTVAPVAGDVMIHSGGLFTNRALLKSDISNLVETDYVLVAGTDQDIFGVKTFKDGVVIETSLTVLGSNTTIETNALTISDPHVDINFGEAGDGVGGGNGTSGIRVDRGTAVGSPGSVNPAAIIQWDENAGQWEIGVEGSLGQVLTGAHTHISGEVLDFTPRVVTELAINDLSAMQDVTYPVAPVDRDHLVFNFGTGQWENHLFATDVTAELNVNDFEQMQDVTYAGVVAGEVLMWSNSPAGWTNHLPVKADISDFVETDYIHTTGDETKVGSLIIDGNFTTTAGIGSETRLKSEHVYITDGVITLNADEIAAGVGGGAGSAGITVERGTEVDAHLIYEETSNTWSIVDGVGGNNEIEVVGHIHDLIDVTDVSATALQVNYLTTTTSDVQIQIDSKISRTGDIMNNGANLTFAIAGEVLGLPDVPSISHAATSMKYVDDQNIIGSGDLSTHIANMDVHLNTDQNIFLDGLTLGGSPGPLLTSVNVNELIGISGNVQTLLDLKANRTAAPASTGNFAALDVNGDLIDSLIIVNDAASDDATIWTSQQIDAAKPDKAPPLLPGNLAGLDVDGNLVDSGLILNDSGSLVTEIWSAEKIDGVKADKKVPAAINNLAKLDGFGNLQDAGALIDDAALPAIGIMWTSDKIDTDYASKDVPILDGNLAALDGTGNLVDSGVIVNDLGTASTAIVWTSNKIDTDYVAQVAGTAGNFVEFDIVSGDIADSGKNATSFALVSHNHVASDVTDFDTAVDTYITNMAVLDDLSNVTVAAPTLLDIMQYNGTTWVNESVFTVFGTDFVRSSGSVAESITGVKTFNDDAAFGGSIVVTGDLTVNGTTTTLDTQNLEVSDKNITVNAGYSGPTSGSTGSGLHVNRNETGVIGSPPLPIQDLATLIWDDALLKWKGGLEGSEEVLATEGSSVAQPFWEIIQAPAQGGSPVLPQLVYNVAWDGGLGQVPSPSTGKTGLQVFVNGVKQIEGAGKTYTVNYSNPSLTVVTFTSISAAPTIGADVEFYGFGYIA